MTQLPPWQPAAGPGSYQPLPAAPPHKYQPYDGPPGSPCAYCRQTHQPPAPMPGPPAYPPQPAYVQQAKPPAHMAHGWGYWLSMGWAVEPMLWMFRMVMWIPPFTPVGIWLSGRRGRKNAERRQRRGYHRTVL